MDKYDYEEKINILLNKAFNELSKDEFKELMDSIDNIFDNYEIEED